MDKTITTDGLDWFYSVEMGKLVGKLALGGACYAHYFSHIYPMMLEHLNLIGEYRFPVDGRALTELDALPLRSLDEALSQLSLGL